MKRFMKENLKALIGIAVMLLCTGILITTSEIRANILPVLSEELSLVYCEMKTEICDYTGNEVEPGIVRIVFEDQNENRLVFYEDEFQIKGYANNIEVGQADIEITVNGYQGTLTIKEAFAIQPARATAPTVLSATKEMIELTWAETIDADGYLLYKSKDNGKSYMPIKEAVAGDSLTYTDKSIGLNEIYLYYIRAYKRMEHGVVFGNPSEVLKQYTPLDNPVIASVNNVAHNTLKLEWSIVNGAAGYQIYRSDKQDGEYVLIVEISDGMVSSYADATCECGKGYFYYIKACQQTETETIYGEASAIATGKTTPEKVSLRGNTSDKETKVTLTWKKVPGAQGYEIYKDDGMVAKIENADTLSWSESGLSKDVEATYTVRGYCVVNNEIIYGQHSGAFVKEVIVETNYSTNVSGDLSSVTQYQGVPYVDGGTTPKGWDCGGFTQWVMKNYYGVSIPKPAAEQGRGGTTISVSDRASWQPGDILCYTYGGKTVRHVALYLGNGKMIHALSKKHDTIIHDVDFYEKWDSKTKLYTVKRYY